MRRDFVANVSHEIRTPLTVLAGFVETMASLPLTEAERQRVLALMQQQTDRMQALVADLLTLAQLEGSPRPPPTAGTADGAAAQVVADGRTLSAGGTTIEAEQADAELAGNRSRAAQRRGNLVTTPCATRPPAGASTCGWPPARSDGGARSRCRHRASASPASTCRG
jgi:two-component system phosphate regulon sensor histidine kinase PhoR